MIYWDKWRVRLMRSYINGVSVLLTLCSTRRNLYKNCRVWELLVAGRMNLGRMVAYGL